MSSRRVLKAAQAIREVVSMAILTDIKDPRVSETNITVTFVEVSPDLRQAKVNVSIMGDDKMKSLCMQGLQSATGFLQKKVGNRIDTRYIPRLKFVLDRGVEHSMVVTKILEDVLPEDKPKPEETVPEAETDKAVPEEAELEKSEVETRPIDNKAIETDDETSDDS